jgi:hypothetical protein
MRVSRAYFDLETRVPYGRSCLGKNGLKKADSVTGTLGYDVSFDIYGHDATLKKALAKGYPYPN